MSATATIACLFCGELNQLALDPSADRPACTACGRPFLLDRPVKVTDDSMEATLLGTTVPVLVDFHADWCQPCRMMAPMLDQLAADLQGEILVAKLDTDANPRMAVDYGIRGIPTLIAFRDGNEWKRHTGLIPPDKLAELLEIDVEVDQD